MLRPKFGKISFNQMFRFTTEVWQYAKMVQYSNRNLLMDACHRKYIFQRVLR